MITKILWLSLAIKLNKIFKIGLINQGKLEEMKINFG